MPNHAEQRRVPYAASEMYALVADIEKYSGKGIDDYDYFIFHQANEFIIKHLVTILKIPPEKVLNSIGTFGNTSSASVPLSLVFNHGGNFQNKKNNYLMLGFGAGHSWAAGSIENEALDYVNLIEYR